MAHKAKTPVWLMTLGIQTGTVSLIAPFIFGFAKELRFLSIPFVRNEQNDVARFQTLSPMIRIIGFIGKPISRQSLLEKFHQGLPYHIHTILTDNGILFSNQACPKYAVHHIFDRVWDAHNIEHKTTKTNLP
ncbi:MAG: hypothetical protein JKY17_01815 [Magnetovibrio sp.]|nr:hypothetical protein [Magnetovibrio sp.]